MDVCIEINFCLKACVFDERERQTKRERESSWMCTRESASVTKLVFSVCA